MANPLNKNRKQNIKINNNLYDLSQEIMNVLTDTFYNVSRINNEDKNNYLNFLDDTGFEPSNVKETSGRNSKRPISNLNLFTIRDDHNILKREGVTKIIIP